MAAKPTSRNIFRIIVDEVQRRHGALPLFIATVFALRPWITPDQPGTGWITVIYQLAAGYLWYELIVRIFRSWKAQQS